jgi:hypothetical protein
VTASTLVARAQARNTERFISDNPSSVVIDRRKRTKTAAGGFVWEHEDFLMAQTVRIIRSGNKGDSIKRTTPDGRVLVVSAKGMAMPGADIQEGDLFDDGEDHWEVLGVSKVPSWRVSFELARNG